MSIVWTGEIEWDDSGAFADPFMDEQAVDTCPRCGGTNDGHGVVQCHNCGWIVGEPVPGVPATWKGKD